MGIEFKFGQEREGRPSPREAHNNWKESLFEVGIGPLGVAVKDGEFRLSLGKSGFNFCFGGGRAPKEIPDPEKVPTSGWSFEFGFDFGRKDEK